MMECNQSQASRTDVQCPDSLAGREVALGEMGPGGGVRWPRVSADGLMAGGVAHELAQPLAVIMSYATACRNQLLAGEPSAERLKHDLDRIIAQTGRAQRVIDRVRHFMRRQQPPRHEIDLNETIRESLALFTSEMRQSRVEVKLKLGRNLPRVWGDGVQIQQVLANLIRNALEAMSQTGSSQHEIGIVSELCSPDFVRVELRDSGGGVPFDLVDRIFDQFFSAREDGMGLGLPISRSIIEAHGGRLWLEPDYIGGAVFRFTLPVARPAQGGTV
jgi:signal transduction histidine kinase